MTACISQASSLPGSNSDGHRVSGEGSALLRLQQGSVPVFLATCLGF